MSSRVEDALLAEEPVRAVREALAGSDRQAWLVGGTVRDALLGRELTDVDVAVESGAEAAARAVGRVSGGPTFPLSEAFGAWRTLSPRRDWVCDVSPVHGRDIGADLAQRDFTVNAMAMPLAGGEIIDPHGGRRDLEAGLLRVVAPTAFEADPLRPLRLARLATELALAPEPETESLTRGAAARVAEASAERVFAELRRLVASDRVVQGIELADRLGLIAAVLPELGALRGVQQSHFHHLDVHDHTLEVLRRTIWLERHLGEVFGDLSAELLDVLEEPLADELSRRQALRFAALLHDIGKPATRGTRADGRVTFIGHDAVGAEQVAALCGRLHTSERFSEFLSAITRHHLVLGFLVHERPLARRTVYRYLEGCQPVEVEVTLLSCADRLATRGRNAEHAIAAHLGLARELMPDALTWRAAGPPSPPVKGDDLARELGIQPGPQLGRLLSDLREARFAGEIATREDAVAYARRLRQDAHG